MKIHSNQIEQRRWRKNVRRVFAMSFFQVFLVIMPVAVPFFQSKGLGMQEVFLLQAIFAVLVLLLEVPSGYVADLFGRKHALVAGAIFCGCGHTALLFADGFWGLALFEACLAFARSLVSGADLAVAYESALQAEPEQAEDHGVVGRLYASRTAAEAVAAIVCSVVLISGSLGDVVAVQAAVGWLPLLFALRIAEPPRARLDAVPHSENFRRVFRHILSSELVVRLVVLMWCIWGLTTYFSVWLLQKIWMEQALDLHHFGYLWCGYMLSAAVAGRLAGWLESKVGPQPVLVFCGVAPVVGYLGLEFAGVIGGALFGALFFFARGFGYVLLQDAFNARMKSEFRATAISIMSFSAGLASALVGPIVGWVVDAWSLQVALVGLAVFSACVFAGLVMPLVVAVRHTTRPAAV